MRSMAFVRIFVAIAFVAPVVACGPAMMMVSQPKGYSGTFKFTLIKPVADFTGMATSVGEALGYHIAGIRDGAVVYSRSAGTASNVIVGTVDEVTIPLKLRPGGRTVDIGAEAVGNFDQATQASVLKLVQRISDEFDRRMKAS